MTYRRRQDVSQLPDGHQMLVRAAVVGNALQLAADQLTFADGHHQGVDSRIVESTVDHRLESMAMVDGVVGNEQPAGNEIGHDRFVAVGVHLLLSIEEAKRDLTYVRNVLEGISLHQFDEVFDSGSSERIPGEIRLLGENLERRERPACGLAGKGEPQGRVPGACSHLDHSSDWSSRGEDGDEPSRLGWYLAEALHPGCAVGTVGNIDLLQDTHSILGPVRNVVEHGCLAILRLRQTIGAFPGEPRSGTKPSRLSRGG